VHDYVEDIVASALRTIQRENPNVRYNTTNNSINMNNDNPERIKEIYKMFTAVPGTWCLSLNKYMVHYTLLY